MNRVGDHFCSKSMQACILWKLNRNSTWVDFDWNKLQRLFQTVKGIICNCGSSEKFAPILSYKHASSQMQILPLTDSWMTLCWWYVLSLPHHIREIPPWYSSRLVSCKAPLSLPLSLFLLLLFPSLSIRPAAEEPGVQQPRLHRGTQIHSAAHRHLRRRRVQRHPQLQRAR